MKLFLTGLLVFTASLANAYNAEVRSLDSKDKSILFKLNVEEKIVGETKEIHALFKSNEKIAVEESAIINKDTAELISSQIQQFQTKEKGSALVVGEKLRLTYEAPGKAIEKKEIRKPKILLSPGNFDDWIAVNFEKIKEEKTLVVDFLVWERLEIYKFKITYLGLVDLDGVPAQSFKLNIDNALFAAFITPIKIWKSEDMKRTLRYEGRVAVKLMKGTDPKNLDGEVIYSYPDVSATKETSSDSSLAKPKKAGKKSK